MTNLKRLYLLASAGWIGFYLVKLMTPSPDRNPHLSGVAFCTLLFLGIAAVGYVLLFLLLPWAGRRLRPS
jgi:hypothetical protein